jgi:hypothetical protein
MKTLALLLAAALLCACDGEDLLVPDLDVRGNYTLMELGFTRRVRYPMSICGPASPASHAWCWRTTAARNWSLRIPPPGW